MIDSPFLSLQGLRILVVDSDLDSRDLLKMVFEEYGIETFVTVSVLEALEIVQRVKPDLLISEIRLPNEDGYSLMCQLKALKNRRQAKIPAIALTTYAQKCDRDRALSVGFDKYLLKPFDMDELISTVAYLTRAQGVPIPCI